MDITCKPLIKAIDNYIEKVDKELEDTLDDEGFVKPKKTVSYLEGIEDDVTDTLLDETDYIVAGAKKAVDLETFAESIWPDIKLDDETKGKLEDIFVEMLNKFLPEYIDYYINQTDKKLKLEQVSKKTMAWVKTWSSDLGEIMQLDSHAEIEDILSKGLKDGDGIEIFTQNILNSGIRDEHYKARRVAITEVLRAHSVAQQEAFMQSPAVSKKTWRHTGSYRNAPRDNHVDIDGQTVPVNEPFELIGLNGNIYHPMYPRDPILPPEESINCHCIMQPAIDKDILGLSLQERKRLQQEAVDKMDDEWEKELDARNKAKAGINEE